MLRGPTSLQSYIYQIYFVKQVTALQVEDQTRHQYKTEKEKKYKQQVNDKIQN